MLCPLPLFAALGASLVVTAGAVAAAAPPAPADLVGRSFVRAGPADIAAGAACPAGSNAVWTFAANRTFLGRCDNGSWTLKDDRLILDFAAGPAREGTNRPGTVSCTAQTERQELYIVTRTAAGDIEASPPVGPLQHWVTCQPDPRANPAGANPDGDQE